MLQDHPILIGSSLALSALLLYSYIRGYQEKLYGKVFKFKCECGKVHGTLRSYGRVPLTCSCKDCNMFADYVHTKHMENQKNPPLLKYTEEFGGVRMCQFPRGSFQVNEGTEYLVHCQVDPKLFTHRYYASCCDTPMFLLSKGPVAMCSFHAPNLDPYPGDPQIHLFLKCRNPNIPLPVEKDDPRYCETVTFYALRKMLTLAFFSTFGNNRYPVNVYDEPVIIS